MACDDVGFAVYNLDSVWAPECYDTCVNGNCVGSGDEFCSCHSLWYGDNCATNYTSCGTIEHAEPLETGFVPELLPASQIQGGDLQLHFTSPIVAERYDYRVLVGGVEGNLCDSWLFPDDSGYWDMSYSGCNVLNDAALSWDEAEETCGWQLTDTGNEYEYRNTIYFQVKEDLTIIQREIEWDYDVLVTIPYTVSVDTVLIDVLAPADAGFVAVLYEQDVFPGSAAGIFKLLTRLAYPYKLDPVVTASTEPSDIDSTVTLADESACVDTPGTDCDQHWENNYDITIPPRCDVSGTYTYDFTMNCQAGYTSCPYEDELVQVVTTIVSEDFCDEVQIQTDLDATMISYEDSEYSEQENGFVYGDTAYFEITVTSDELTVYESKVTQMCLQENGNPGNEICLYIDELVTLNGDPSHCNFVTTPAQLTPRFSFLLHDPTIPVNNWVIHATVEVEYEFETTRRREITGRTYSFKTTSEMELVSTGDGDLEQADGFEVAFSMLLL